MLDKVGVDPNLEVIRKPLKAIFKGKVGEEVSSQSGSLVRDCGRSHGQCNKRSRFHPNSSSILSFVSPPAGSVALVRYPCQPSFCPAKYLASLTVLVDCSPYHLKASL